MSYLGRVPEGREGFNHNTALSDGVGGALWLPLLT